nr:MAG TPA: hypothetical protein [Caudoviricetes sp.]
MRYTIPNSQAPPVQVFGRTYVWCTDSRWKE